jgi:hypothetical protein
MQTHLFSAWGRFCELVSAGQNKQTIQTGSEISKYLAFCGTKLIISLRIDIRNVTNIFLLVANAGIFFKNSSTKLCPKTLLQLLKWTPGRSGCTRGFAGPWGRR